MSTFLDDIFGPIAQDLLGVLGKPVTMTPPASGGGYDPGADPSAPGSAVTVTALVEAADPQRWAAELIQKDARQLSIAGADLAAPPGPGVSFTIDGESFTVPPDRGVRPIYSGEDVAMWVVLANRG